MTNVMGTIEIKKVVNYIVREGVRLQIMVNEERAKQENLRESGQPYNFTMAHNLGEGVHGMAEVLWDMFAGMTIDMIEAIERTASTGLKPGYTNQDFAGTFFIELEKIQGHPARVR